jgi:tricorn protease
VVVPDDLYKDFGLSYRDWVQSNRDKVETAGSELGYVHIQAMGPGDVATFAREFYASDSKKGMVIDVRRNNGGNVDSWIIDRLMRKAWMFWSFRSDDAYFNLQNVFRGHLVVLADERTYSDGETFTAAIKKLGIAPVIGKRTAGAGVWLSGRNRLSDSGIARVAEFPAYDMDGQWIVEGHGVSPTIEVDNLPHATYEGADAQLDAAIEYLKKKLEEDPVLDVEAKPFPANGVPAKDVLH